MVDAESMGGTQRSGSGAAVGGDDVEGEVMALLAHGRAGRFGACLPIVDALVRGRGQQAPGSSSLVADVVEVARWAHLQGDDAAATAMLAQVARWQPATLAVWLPSFRAMAEASEAALLTAALEGWRAVGQGQWPLETVEVALTLLKRQRLRAAFVLLHAVVLADGVGEALLWRLRAGLDEVYGVPWPRQDGFDASYLLAAGEAQRPGVLPAPLLFDALLGSVYEAWAEDEVAGEVIFHQRVAPGLRLSLSATHVAGVEGCGRQGGRRSLAFVMVFLLAMAGLIAGMGVWMRSCL